MKVKRTTVYLLGFLFGIHVALPAYLVSTFLSDFVTERFVGLVYIVGSILAIVAISRLSHYLRHFGNYRVTSILVMVELFAMLLAALTKNPVLAVLAIVVSFVTIALLNASMDVFLEHYSENGDTGDTRGRYLVSINAAWVIAQILLSFFIYNSAYSVAFMLAAATLIPVSYIIDRSFKHFDDAPYKHVSTLKSIRSIRHNKNLSSIVAVNFLLQFFYAWMVIYMPLYLHNHLGFTLQQMSILASVMLLPFLLFELPLGTLADKRLGEKEIIVAGFIFLAVTVFIAGTTHETSLLFWTVLMFLSRVGAAAVEIASETYFFKKIRDADLGYITIFRTTRPWSNIVAPAIATLLIPLFGLQALFVVLSACMLYGIRFALAFKDTK